MNKLTKILGLGALVVALFAGCEEKNLKCIEFSSNENLLHGKKLIETSILEVPSYRFTGLQVSKGEGSTYRACTYSFDLSLTLGESDEISKLYDSAPCTILLDAFHK